MGCGVADGTTGEQSGGTFVVGAPCTPDPQSATCPPGGVFGPKQNVPCQAWTAAWADWVTPTAAERGGPPRRRRRDPRPPLPRAHDEHFAPDLRRLRGEPAREGCADRHGPRRADGLQTKPCQSTGEQPDGAPWPQDSAARQDAYNDCCDKVAAQHPGQVYVQDLNSYVCPGGHLHRGPRRRPGARERREPLRHAARRRRRLSGAGDPPVLDAARPPAGGTDERSERAERITPPLLRPAVRPAAGDLVSRRA